MQRTGRLLAFVASMTLLAGACTGDGNGGTDGSDRTTGPEPSGSSPTPGGPVPVESGAATSGTYEYENAGLRVVLDIEGTSGTMEVDNGTGHGLEDPGFYILDARDGHEIDGSVTDPTTVEDGDTTTFDIAFRGVEVRNIGLVVLLFGADNYGAFVRTG